ncbi:MAG: DUF1854 domain-containing protein [Ruminococcaceae bacterium]|nr:DUF1854 domain-containing protein [Oscillospiraceae bacterium]
MEISGITYLNEENAKFYDKDGFLALKAFIPPKSEYDLEEETVKEPEWQDLGRVFLHRAFPFNNPDKYISVVDISGYEYGMIKDIAEFSEESRNLIMKSLDRKYFMPNIEKIISIKEQFGFSFWKVQTDRGEAEFTVKDTYKSIVKLSENLVVILDSNDSRYMIKDIYTLEPSSYKKIELYL